jgi:hypothetical protein
MAKVSATIVYDELGQIKSVARPSEEVGVIILSGDGESVLKAEVDEESIDKLLDSHRVDVANASLVENTERY